MNLYEKIFKRHLLTFLPKLPPLTLLLKTACEKKSKLNANSLGPSGGKKRIIRIIGFLGGGVGVVTVELTRM